MNFITAGDTRLAYEKSGYGSRTVFTFHGVGQSHKVFNNLSFAYPPGLYTIYSFDLFYHGMSTHTMSKEVRKYIWKHMIEKLITQDGIREIDLVSYSIGSVFSICTFMMIPEQVRTITLIAPDGLKKNSIQALATSSYGRPIFRYLMTKPYLLIKTLGILKITKIISETFYRLLMYQLTNRQKRMNIYASWVNFKPLYHDFDDFKALCFDYMPVLTFFLGKEDEVIKVNAIKPYAKELPNVTIRELPTNHRKMISETLKYLQKK